MWAKTATIVIAALKRSCLMDQSGATAME